MKNIKKIVMLLLIFSLVMVTGCNKKNENKKLDGLAFKEDYESLNGKENSKGQKHREVKINEKNPFVFSNTDEILKMIEEKETFYVYFGDKQCPWCRSVIEKAIEVANNKEIEKIYYINIWDDEHNEILRDVYELDENNKPVQKTKGTDNYYKLLEVFKDVLRDYTLSTTSGDKVEVGEKRIYAPNFIYVENGKVIEMTSGKSDNQTDSRQELTEELLKDEEEAFDNFFKDGMCVTDEGC